MCLTNIAGGTYKTRTSVRDGSIVRKSHIILQQWMLLTCMWALKYPVGDAVQEADVSKTTAIDV